jgi:SAM-dependent methyltransferase
MSNRQQAGQVLLEDHGRSKSPTDREHLCVGCEGSLASFLKGIFDTRFGIEGRWETRRCQRCGLEQLYPRPSNAELKHLYQEFYNFRGERGGSYIALREWFMLSPWYRLWAFLDGDTAFHTQRGRGRLLDIGCNEGRGLKLYSRNGFDAEGLELNERAAGVARAAGFKIYAELVEHFEPDELYDVVILSNVLEHSLDPRTMLGHIRRLLKPHGQIWISCPNSRSWLRRFFGRFWINWHVPFHIVHFSPRLLRDILVDSGYSGVEIRQITPALWLASSIVARVFAREGKPTLQLRNAFLMFGLILFCRLVFFPLLVLGNVVGRGDCLVAMAEACD